MIGADPNDSTEIRMEAVDVRGRFMWHQLLTRDVPGAKDRVMACRPFSAL